MTTDQIVTIAALLAAVAAGIRVLRTGRSTRFGLILFIVLAALAVIKPVLIMGGMIGFWLTVLWEKIEKTWGRKAAWAVWWIMVLIVASIIIYNLATGR